MGFIRSRNSSKRPSYQTGLVLTRVTRAGEVASAWPRQRPKKVPTRVAANHAFFTQVVKTIALMQTAELKATADAAKALNKAHRGLQGAQSLRPEDYHTARLMGRAFAIALPDGRTAWPLPAVMDVSRWLDWMEPRLGSLLTRTDVAWLPTYTCVAGAKFTATPSGPLSSCCKGAALATQADGVKS